MYQPFDSSVSYPGQGKLDQLASFLGFDLEGFTDVRMNGNREFTGIAAKLLLSFSGGGSGCPSARSGGAMSVFGSGKHCYLVTYFHFIFTSYVK